MREKIEAFEVSQAGLVLVDGKPVPNYIISSGEEKPLLWPDRAATASCQKCKHHSLEYSGYALIKEANGAFSGGFQFYVSAVAPVRCTNCGYTSECGNKGAGHEN